MPCSALRSPLRFLRSVRSSCTLGSWVVGWGWFGVPQVGLLMDRQELQTRAHNFCTAQGQQEHWVDSPPGTPLKPRPDALASLGPNLMADDR